MKQSQQMIHKLDISGESVSPVLQMDMFLSDIQEQINLILEEKTESIKHLRLTALQHYVRGYRDGNRFYKGNPTTS